ncbi:hypothetical protein N9E02_00125 [Ilumatobacteraceae bacterium]|nr:hypothetical protein [Ilumatobacteraceae bacterium]
MTGTKGVTRKLVLVALLTGGAGVVSVQAPVVTALPDEFETVEDSLGYLDLPYTTEGYFGDIVDDPNGAFVLVRSTSADRENRLLPPDPSIIKIDTSTGTRSGSIELPYTASAIAVSADGATALIGLRYGTEMWLVDTATMTKTGTITSLPDGMNLGYRHPDTGDPTNWWQPLTATMNGGNAFIAFQESGVSLASAKRTRVLRVDLDDDPAVEDDYLSMTTVSQLNYNGVFPVAMAVNSTGDDLVVFSATSTRFVGQLELHDLSSAWDSNGPTVNYIDQTTLLDTGLADSCGVLSCNADVVIIDNGSIIENGLRKAAAEGDVWDAYVAVARSGTDAKGRTLWSWDENGGEGSQEIVTDRGQRDLTSLVHDGNYLYLGWDINPGGITRVDLTTGATATQTFAEGEGVDDSRITSMALVNGVIYAGTGAAPGKVMMIPTASWPDTDGDAPTPAAVLGSAGLVDAVDVEASPDGNHLYVMLDQEPTVLQRVRISDDTIDATLQLPDGSSLDNSNQQFNIAYDHDAGRAYVDLYSDPLEIAVVDLDAMTVVDTITDDSAIFAGVLAVRSTTNELLVLLDEGGGTTVLGRFDLATGDRLADVATTQALDYADSSSLALDPTQSALFIAAGDVVERIALDNGTTTSATIDEADVGVDAADFVEAVASPDGAHVYFLSAANGYHIRIVKIATGDLADRSMATLVEDFESADYGPPTVAISPDGSMLYALTYDYEDCGCNNRIVVVDTSTMMRTDSIDVYPTSNDFDYETLAVSPDGATGYVINADPGFVSTFNARTSWTTTDIVGFDVLGDSTWASADQIACNAAGECLAAGTYDDLNGIRQVFISRSHNGVWTAAEPIPALITLNTGDEGFISVVDMDCDGVDTCVVVGQYASGYTDDEPLRADGASLSFVLVISTDPTSPYYSVDDATFFTDETLATTGLEVPNGSEPVAVDCTLGAGTCSVIGMVTMLTPAVEGFQDQSTFAVTMEVSALGASTPFAWSGLPETTVVDDLACNIAPTHCVAVGRYLPDEKGEPDVEEIIGVALAPGSTTIEFAPDFLAVDGYNLKPDDLMVSCPPSTTPAASTTVECWLAGSYESSNGDNRTPFTAVIGTPTGDSNLIRNVEGLDVYGRHAFPDVPRALDCVSATACVMVHDADGINYDLSRLWEFGSGTPVRDDRDERSGYGSQFMSDWTVDVSLFQGHATSDLSCVTSDHCVITGSFAYRTMTRHPYVITKHDGQWGYAERVPGVPYPDQAAGEVQAVASEVHSVSCPAVDACVAVGTVWEDGASSARAIIVEQHAATVIAPTPPRNVDATSADNEVTVTWELPTAGSDSAIDYVITVSDAAGDVTCEAESPATQCVVSGLANGDYEVTATATNRFGTSWASNPAEVTVSADDADAGDGGDSGDDSGSDDGSGSGGGGDSGDDTGPATETTPPATTPTSLAPTDTSVAPSLAEVMALPEGALLDSPLVIVGGVIELTIGGFTAGDSVRLVVASDPQVLGSAVADASGTVTVDGVIPLDLSPGEHTLAVIDGDGFGIRQTITVTGVMLPATGSGSSPMFPALLVALGVAVLLAGRRRAR